MPVIGSRAAVLLVAVGLAGCSGEEKAEDCPDGSPAVFSWLNQGGGSLVGSDVFKCGAVDSGNQPGTLVFSVKGRDPTKLLAFAGDPAYAIYLEETPQVKSYPLDQLVHLTYFQGGSLYKTNDCDATGSVEITEAAAGKVKGTFSASCVADAFGDPMVGATTGAFSIGY
jgi:hypothetical protein